MASAAAVEAKGVTKVFGAGQDAVRALDGVSVTIRENEFFTLLGPSGCGKTTLLRLIAGFEFPTEGEILLYGEDIAPLPPFKRPVNTVFQNYALFPHMTVGAEHRLRPRDAGQAQGRGRRRGSPRCCGWCAWRNCATARTSQISGGQQQRVALARALAPQPKVLLLDEPLSALDFKLRKDMQIELKRLQHETGITFVFVTHDQEEALTMSDRIAVMSQGHDPADRQPARDLRPPGRALRRQLHRRDQLPPGRAGRLASGKASVRARLRRRRRSRPTLPRRLRARAAR